MNVLAFVILLWLPGTVSGVSRGVGASRTSAAAMGGAVIIIYDGLIALNSFPDLGSQGQILLLSLVTTIEAIVVIVGLLAAERPWN